MAEHFAFKKALRDTAQVDLYKRLFHPLAVDVDGFGNQFLTCSTLTGNQHRSIWYAQCVPPYSTLPSIPEIFR